MANRKSLLQLIGREGKEVGSVAELKFVNSVNNLSQNLSDEDYEACANLMALANNRGAKRGIIVGLILGGVLTTMILIPNCIEKKAEKVYKHEDDED